MSPLISKYPIIRLREYMGNGGGFEFCATKCHYVFGPKKERRESRCCSQCNAEYLDADARAVVKKDLGIVPIERDYKIEGSGDMDHGFWRKGIGCALPLEYRPMLCLTWWCGDALGANAVVEPAMTAAWAARWSGRWGENPITHAKRIQRTS